MPTSSPDILPVPTMSTSSVTRTAPHNLQRCSAPRLRSPVTTNINLKLSTTSSTDTSVQCIASTDGLQAGPIVLCTTWSALDCQCCISGGYSTLASTLITCWATSSTSRTRSVDFDENDERGIAKG